MERTTMRAPVWVTQHDGGGREVPAHWVGTVERGKKKGWYKIEFRSRPRLVIVRPDRVRPAKPHTLAERMQTGDTYPGDQRQWDTIQAGRNRHQDKP